jgi:hypothetical protein
MDAADNLRATYQPERALRDLRREAETRIWERRPRKRLTRTRQGVLYEYIDVDDSELPEFVRARQ